MNLKSHFTQRMQHEISRATVALWPTAYRFKRGHRIRVQVSSGVILPVRQQDQHR